MSPSALLDAAGKAKRAGDFAVARGYYERLLKANPNTKYKSLATANLKTAAANDASEFVKTQAGNALSTIGVGGSTTTIEGHTFVSFQLSQAGPAPWNVQLRIAGIPPVTILVGGP